MIYYNLNTINDWNFGDDNIIKVYKHGAVCYYKITSGDTPTPVQEPCFAVVDDITQYQDTEFEDVFNMADEKWYKLNNLNQYEEYGVYGDSISSGGTSRLPDGYTEVEYVQNTSSAYLNLNINPTDAIGNSFVIESKLLGEWFSGGGTWEYLISNEQGNASPYYGFGIRLTNGSPEVLVSDETNVTTGLTLNSDSTSSFTISVSSASRSNTTPITLFCGLQGSTVWRNGRGKLYSFKLTLNNTLVRDLVPCKRDSDSMVGMYDLANDVFYYPPNYSSYQFVAGSAVTPTAATYYEGKLAIDDGYEYIYSGGSWVNIGEVSGSTITIKSPEYIEKDSSHSGKINLDYVWKTNSKMQFKFYSTNNGGGGMIGEDGMPDNNDCRMFFASTTAYFDWGSSRISWSSNGRTNTLYEYEYGNYYIKNMVTSTSKTGSTISTSRTNTLYFGQGSSDRFRTYYLKFYDGDTLVKDFIPWTDMNGNYGLFDKVSLSVYNVVSGSLTGSSNVTDVEVGGGYEYPLEYPVKQDPPDNLVFSTMAEADAYECPWVGMKATIDGDKYIFSGDSQSGYEWVYNPSRLPVGYTEVEYIQNTGTSYLNIAFTPNQDTRVVCDMQMVTASNFPRLWGAGAWNSANGLMINYEGGKLQMSWLGNTSWTSYTSVPTSFDRKVYDVNKNYLYVDSVQIGSNTYTTRTASDPIGVFTYIGSGRPSSSSYWGQEHFKGKMYSFKVYDNGTLVRDLVPCIRDNDNTVGAYDIVNDVFYTVPTGYTTDKLVAGDPV